MYKWLVYFFKECKFMHNNAENQVKNIFFYAGPKIIPSRGSLLP